MEQVENVNQNAAVERPNRDAFAGRFSKRHSDIDFEDKEARYGALNEDADRLDQYESSGRALSNVFENNRWMASMFEALRQDKDLDPITWMADNGIDIAEAMADEEYRKKISDKIAEFQKREIEGSKKEQEREANLKKSADALASLGMSPEENASLWSDFFENVVNPVLRGEVSKETWEMLKKAKNYDNDVQFAADQAGMKARNEKIRNKVRPQSESEIPPTLPQGGGDTPRKATKKGGFWDDLT